MAKFELGNRYSKIWEHDEVFPLFVKALEFAETDDSCLCIQDAIRYIGIPHSTFYYLCKNNSDLDNIKDDINNAVICRINKGALKGDYNPTAGIWRMKQLGEKDIVGHDMSGNLSIQQLEPAKFAIDDGNRSDAPKAD